jgi:diaminopropionate ammonia-lyase
MMAVGTQASQDGLRVLLNPAARREVPGLTAPGEPVLVHRKLPGYAPTPLVSCPGLAARLGVGEVLVKDESWRLGLPAFKILGASYAVCRALAARLGREVTWQTLDELRAELARLGPLTLAAATDGNHGKAVARMARLLGLGALIYVPQGTAPARIAAIAAEGASVTEVAGDYDAAVRRSARDERAGCLVISDTSWPGYTRIPRWVTEGYSTIFVEASEQLAAMGARQPDVVAVPVGVGALAAAAVRHFKSATGGGAPFLIGVEPEGACCVLESLRAGQLVTVPGPHTSIMAGLNCGTPSHVAWPLLRAGLDAVVAVTDDWARLAMRELDAARIIAGETGAAALAGLLATVTTPEGRPVVQAARLGPGSSVLLLVTEGATDARAWEQVVGHRPGNRGRPGEPGLSAAG